MFVECLHTWFALVVYIIHLAFIYVISTLISLFTFTYVPLACQVIRVMLCICAQGSLIWSLFIHMLLSFPFARVYSINLLIHICLSSVSLHINATHPCSFSWPIHVVSVCSLICHQFVYTCCPLMVHTFVTMYEYMLYPSLDHKYIYTAWCYFVPWRLSSIVLPPICTV